MDETRPRIVSHTSASESHRRFSQHGQVATREADVHRFALNVQAVLCHASTAPAEQVISGLGTVSRDDVEGTTGAELLAKGMEQIQQLGADGFNLPGSMIPQDIVEVIQCLGQVVTLSPVNGIERLSRVYVLHGEGSLNGQRTASCGQDSAGEKTQHKAKHAQPDEIAATDLYVIHVHSTSNKLNLNTQGAGLQPKPTLTHNDNDFLGWAEYRQHVIVCQAETDHNIWYSWIMGLCVKRKLTTIYGILG